MKHGVIIARKTRLTALERLHKGELQKKKKRCGQNDARRLGKISLTIQHFTYLAFRYQTETIDVRSGSDY